MPPKPASGSKASSKRKSEEHDARASKRPRSTINNFFAPQIAVHESPGIESIGRRTSGGTTNVTLSVEQRQVLRMVVEEEKNVFFTGSAGKSLPAYSVEKLLNYLIGTGKSLLLKAIIASLRRKYAKTPEAVAVTASTGMAASNIGGASYIPRASCLSRAMFQVRLSMHGARYHLLLRMSINSNVISDLPNLPCRDGRRLWSLLSMKVVSLYTLPLEKQLTQSVPSFYGRWAPLRPHRKPGRASAETVKAAARWYTGKAMLLSTVPYH